MNPKFSARLFRSSICVAAASAIGACLTYFLWPEYPSFSALWVIPFLIALATSCLAFIFAVWDIAEAGHSMEQNRLKARFWQRFERNK
jgi:hypothetical protein